MVRWGSDNGHSFDTKCVKCEEHSPKGTIYCQLCGGTLAIMPETFQVIGPYLKEHGINLSAGQPAYITGMEGWLMCCYRFNPDIVGVGWKGHGDIIYTNGTEILTTGNEKFDLHDPRSLQKLVGYLLRYHGKHVLDPE